MKTGPSIMIVWRLAAEESSQVGASEVEPRHVLCATLKFAEIDLGRVVEGDGRLIAVLEEEQASVVALLVGRGMTVPTDTARVRRSLRERVGPKRADAGQGNDGVHRSPLTRAAFSRAEAKQEAKHEPLTAAALAEAILDEPDESLGRALAAAGFGRPIAAAPGEEPGTDMTAAAGKRSPAAADAARIRKDAVCRVLSDYLLAPQAAPVLLVGDLGRTAAEVMGDLAFRLRMDDAPPGAARRRIFAVNAIPLLERRAGAEQVEATLAVAAKEPSWVLFVNPFDRHLLANDGPTNGLRRWQGFVSEARCGCVFGVPAERFEERVAADRGWSLRPRVVRVPTPSPSANW